MKNAKRIVCLVLSVLLLSSLFSAPAAADTAETGNSPVRVSACVAGDNGRTVGFCWYTAEKADSVVTLRDESGTAIAGATLSDPVCEAWEGLWMHKVTASNLPAETLVTYTVGDGANTVTGTVKTGGAADSVKFIEIADVQASSAENFEKGAATLRAAFEALPDAAFVANCGDFTNDSTNEEWDLYDAAFGELNRGYLLAPVSGNHDGFGVANWFNNMFNLDTSESVQTKNGVNYSFDYGNAHFAVLNTNDCLNVSRPQLKWLKNDMNSTDKDWKIVFIHKSPYTLGKDGKWPDALQLQKTLTKVCDETNVDLVIGGHDHQYLRTKPLTHNRLDENGVTYLLSGTAGSKRYEVREFLAGHFMKKQFIDALVVQKGGYGNYWNGTDWKSTDENNIGGCYNTVEITGGKLTLNAYILGDESHQSKKIDTLTLTKNTGENKITFTGDNTTSKAAYTAGSILSYASLLFYTLTNWLPRFLALVPELIYSVAVYDTF